VAADYVGTLYAVQLEGEPEPIDVEEITIGVDPHLGIVSARNRSDLALGEYINPPDVAPEKCERLWYRRHRADYPGGDRWYHDLDSAEAFSQQRPQGPPLVIIVGPDVEKCPQSGAFLCG